MGEGLGRRPTLGRRTHRREHHIGGVRGDRRQQPDKGPAHSEPGEAEADSDRCPLPCRQMVDRRTQDQRTHHPQPLAGEGHADGRDQAQAQVGRI